MAFICPAEFTVLAEKLADAARPIVQRYFRSDMLVVEQKKLHDPVTMADRKIEELWRNMIADTRPQDGIWGEEFGRSNEDAEWTWILDPIDGTKAFTLGRPTFGCMIGLHHTQHGFVAGVVDQPIIQYRWTGARGCGATLNGNVLKTHAVMMHDARIALTNPFRFTPEVKRLKDMLQNEIGYYAYGGDCMNYMGLADGGVHAMFDSMQKIYDIAAAIPIIEEAGGVITHLDGSPIDFVADHTIMAAHTPELHVQLLQRYQAIVDQGL